MLKRNSHLPMGKSGNDHNDKNNKKNLIYAKKKLVNEGY